MKYPAHEVFFCGSLFLDFSGMPQRWGLVVEKWLVVSQMAGVGVVVAGVGFDKEKMCLICGI